MTRGPKQVWLLIVALLTSVAIHRHASADDWPTYRHDHRRSAVSKETADTSRLIEAWRWRSATPPLAAWPGPARWDAYAGLRGLRAMRNYDPAFHVIAVGDSIYFASNSDDTVRSLNAESGNVNWTFTADGPVRVAPEYVDGKLYFGADDGSAYCLSAVEGKLIWRRRPIEPKRWLLNDGRLISTLPVRSGVLVRDDRAYFTASLTPWSESFICCVDAATGESENGFIKSVGNGKTLEGAMLASRDELILPQGRVAPLVFDLANGTSKGALPGGGGSFVLLTEDDHILHGPGNKQAVIVDSSSESRKKVASYENGNAIVVAGDTSYLLSDSSLAAYDRTDKKIRWLVPSETPFDLILVGDTLFAAGNGKVAAYSSSDGTQVWSADVEGRAHGLAFSEGRLLVTTELGVIHCFAAGDKVRESPLMATSDQVAKQSVATTNVAASPPIAKVRERGLLDRWVFQRNAAQDPKIENQVRPLPATVAGRFQIKPAGSLEALELDGVTNDVVVLQEFDPDKSPSKELTAEAWVRVDQSLEWGGLIGISQDNGSYERGWLLGFRNEKFGFAVAGEQGNGQLTWLVAEEAFLPGSWHHVAGSYDGEFQKLYVDGKLVAESKVQKGPVRYPETARYVVGSYWDKDEHFRTKGALHEVRLYDRALDDRMIERHAAEKADMLPKAAVKMDTEYAKLAAGPMLRFVQDGGAIVRWETEKPSATRLTVHLKTKSVQEHLDPKPKTQHEVRLDPLAPSTLFGYHIYIDSEPSTPPNDSDADGDQVTDKTDDDGNWVATREYGCDTHFNYARMNGAMIDLTAGRDESVLWPRTGMAIVVDDMGIAERLAEETAMYVALVSRDEPQVEAARRSWIADGKYGPRLTARLLDERIPTHSLNLVVVPEGSDASTWKSLLQPGGKLIQGDKVVEVGEPFDGASTWTHMYGRPDNSAYAGENLSDAASYDDLTLQWLGRPGPRYQSDRGNRKPAPLAAGGRLYMQGLNRLIAVNAYSGIVIWSLELPELQRFNIPRDTCNWCADDDFLWISMGDRIWKLDGATGKMIESRSVDRPEGASDEVTWGFLARVEDQLFGSAVAEGGHYKDWWGGASWYDAKDGSLTHKVCSMNLVAYEADSGKTQWVHERGGAIMNPTVTIVDDLVVFAENPNLYAKQKSRFDDSIFSQLRLVALDRKTGKVRWEKPVEQRDGTVACYVAATSEGIIYQTSKGGEFDVSLRDPKTGDVKWSKTYKWEVDHHGKHLSRPAIVNGRIVIRPHVIDIKTGENLEHKFPKGHQCGTYTCSDKALFLRAGDLTMWNLEDNDSSKLKRVRPDCWISTIPALGMLLSPEGGGGCSCGSWLETSMGFIPNVHAER